jgi:5-methylcytosine-specific restriction endonuclease McrA
MTREEEYKEYLSGTTWQIKRNLALERARNRCQLCNSRKNLEVHHRKYPLILGNEPQEDLTVLCHRCHNLFTRKVQKKYKHKVGKTPIHKQEFKVLTPDQTSLRLRLQEIRERHKFLKPKKVR